MLHHRTGRRAFSRVEAVVVIACTIVVLALVVPALGGARNLSSRNVSMVNMVTLGAAHAAYAADWNGRQITLIDDAISTYGNVGIVAFANYQFVNGVQHPGFVLGWGVLSGDVGEWRYSTITGTFVVPTSFAGEYQGFGTFRVHNGRPLHDYVNGRYYDPVFYPPNDPAVYALVEPGFSDPWEFAFLDGIQSGLAMAPGSYCPSPAAMFHPDVMRHPDDGGWQDPWDLDHGFESPGLYTATYAHLKTQLLEHHWLQNAPDDYCNPAFEPGTFDGCEPYFFNHGFASAPATLFYDMSVRELPNTEVIAADEQITMQTGSGLWSRDTPMGLDGYFGDLAFDPINVSHHVLTTDGILGRDTIEGFGDAPTPKTFGPFDMGSAR